MTVRFDEPLRAVGPNLGRDAAFDWTVTADQDGDIRSRTVTTVLPGPDRASRVLQVAAESYDPARGAVTGVRYKFRGLETERYSDRATNAMPDQATT